MTQTAPDPKQFRFVYFTSLYDDTVAFYRDRLGLPVCDRWDRSADDKGTVFGAASGRIEVLSQPVDADTCEHLFDTRPPQGAFMVIELADVDRFHAQLRTKGVEIERELRDQSWGHRSFLIREPNGLVLYFYSDR